MPPVLAGQHGPSSSCDNKVLDSFVVTYCLLTITDVNTVIAYADEVWVF